MVDNSPAFMEWGRNNCRSGGFSGRNRCFINRMGRFMWNIESSRPMVKEHVVQVFKFQGAVHSSDGSKNISKTVPRQDNPGAFRQCHHGGLLESYGGSLQRTHRLSKDHLDRMFSKQSNDCVTSSQRQSECESRSFIQNSKQVRMASQPAFIQCAKQHMGPSFMRSFCITDNHSPSFIQQQISRSTNFRSGCPGTKRLVLPQQLCQRTVPVNSKSFEGCQGAKGKGDSYSTLVASSSMVQHTQEYGNLFTSETAKYTSSISGHEQRQYSRTTVKSQVENIRMEDMWKDRLMSVENWSERAATQIAYSLAPSTMKLYNTMVDRLYLFCIQKCFSFPPIETSVISDFLCELADSSSKPKSVLNNATAAISCLYETLDLCDITKHRDLMRLKQSLIKSGTSQPMKKSVTMPVENFKDLFVDWPVNDELSIKQIRLKAITLLALVAMLRPSDIAPKSVIFDPRDMKCYNNVLLTDSVIFKSDGSLSMVLHGIKNDTSRTGFEIDIPPHSNPQLDPVDALKVYIDKTQKWRSNRELFIQLQAPYKPITAATVGNILEEAITLAGLSTDIYSAKSFRPTGATVAINEGHDPRNVMKMGRWKTQSVFYEHYVHSRIPVSFTDDILS